MGTNILFLHCQRIGSKPKELELYLIESNFDIVAWNEMFLTKKIDFKIQVYDTMNNDRSTGSRDGVGFLVKHGLVVNKEYRDIYSNIITDNEALVIELIFVKIKIWLWLPFTALVEIQTSSYFKPRIFLSILCLSAI